MKKKKPKKYYIHNIQNFNFDNITKSTPGLATKDISVGSGDQLMKSVLTYKLLFNKKGLKTALPKIQQTKIAVTKI